LQTERVQHYMHFSDIWCRYFKKAQLDRIWYLKKREQTE